MERDIKRPGHRPMRTCIGCRTVRPQEELVRITGDGAGNTRVEVEFRAPGRGAYLCPRSACVETARRRRALERALRQPVNPASWEAIAMTMTSRIEEAGT